MPVRESPMAKFERLLEAGDNEGALLVANEVLKQSPGSFFARLGRARALMRLRNFIDADTECNLAIQISPKDDLARVVRANLDVRLGRTDEALVNLRAVAHGRSVHAHEAMIDLLQTLNDAGRYDEARQLFDVEPDQIEVVVHPQSVVHSMVGFRDGSIIAQVTQQATGSEKSASVAST